MSPLLLFITVTIYSFGLKLIDQGVFLVQNGSGKNRLQSMASAVIMRGVALCASMLHCFKGAIWTAAYLLLRALPDRKSAMLYSLGAMTTYGHANIHLDCIGNLWEHSRH
ncbi:MAG TPA: hypothetical protein VKH63_22825 [Candidatus Acidoferrum sp.]|nr:hypothetical protein [Candidatus Acidoferrum sp.]